MVLDAVDLGDGEDHVAGLLDVRLAGEVKLGEGGEAECDEVAKERGLDKALGPSDEDLQGSKRAKKAWMSV